MKRLMAIFFTMALVLAFSVPAAIADNKDSAKCQKECETQAETCKQTCDGDTACEKDCTEQEADCKLGCN